jgi:putative spermidine/putrescine transport system ATP-binding protein
VTTGGRTESEPEVTEQQAVEPKNPGLAGTLELKDVAKQFGDVMAVEGVNLQIDSGDYVVLLGPSGCGKTTILRMIGGHEYPTSGDIVLDGHSLVGIPPAKHHRVPALRAVPA